jgi:serine/threonine protein kinase
MQHYQDHPSLPSKAFGKVRYGDVMLLKPLARGGMAEIYLAEQKGSDGTRQQVIVKQPLRKHRGSRLHQRMLLDEARLGQHLSHPNIVRTLDWGLRGKMPYLVLEYVRGPSVRILLKKLAEAGEKLSMEEVLYILTQVLSALSYAHAVKHDDGRPMHVVHRDVTPDNILLTASGEVKLIDFGVAKATGRSEQTEAGMVKGKVPYFAPEQLSSGPVDHRVDQYALSLTVCEMLTGGRVFAADNDGAIVSQVLEGASARILGDRDLLGALGPLRDVLLRALARDPAARFGSCAEMAEELQALTLIAEPDKARERLALRIANIFHMAAPPQEPQEVRPPGFWTSAGTVALGGLCTLVVACSLFGVVRLAQHLKARPSAPQAQAVVTHIEDVPDTSVLSKFTSVVSHVAAIFSNTPTASVQSVPASRGTWGTDMPRGKFRRDNDNFEPPGRRGAGASVFQGEGDLDVSCLRWCEITVDGAVRATSPMRNRRLPAGSYLIEAVNPPTGQVAMQRVTIHPGEHILVQFRL